MNKRLGHIMYSIKCTVSKYYMHLHTCHHVTIMDAYRSHWQLINIVMSPNTVTSSIIIYNLISAIFSQ